MKITKRVAAALLVFTLLVSALAGCGSGAGSSAGTESTGEGGSRGSVDKDTLVLRVTNDPVSFDPTQTTISATLHVLRQIYDGLVSINNDGSVELLLAEDYDVSEDYTFYTFHLRKGVKFHNGEELKASDVVFSIHHAMDSAHTKNYVEWVDSCIVPN